MDGTKIIKGSLALVVLQLLQHNKRMYGYEITKAVKEGSKGKTKITESALYPTLRKLLDDGLVETESEIVDGRERKYYMLTKKGVKESDHKLIAMQEAISSLQRLLKYKLGHG